MILSLILLIDPMFTMALAAGLRLSPVFFPAGPHVPTPQTSTVSQQIRTGETGVVQSGHHPIIFPSGSKMISSPLDNDPGRKTGWTSSPLKHLPDLQDTDTADIFQNGASHLLTRSPQKSQVNVHKLLSAWRKDATANERQAVARHDNHEINMLRYKAAVVQKIQEEIETKKADHIIGLAVGEASEGNIQAVASLILGQSSWRDRVSMVGGDRYDQYDLYDQYAQYDRLAATLGLPAEPMPVVVISKLVATPNHPQKTVGARPGAELIYRIAAWANDMGRLVLVVPANEKLEEYYKSIGFERYDAFGTPHTLVFRGSHGMDLPGRGLLLDLL